MKPALLESQSDVVKGILNVEDEKENGAAWKTVPPKMAEIVDGILDSGQYDPLSHSDRAVVLGRPEILHDAVLEGAVGFRFGDEAQLGWDEGASQGLL